MTEPSYDDLVAALDEFHAEWHARPWSLDRLQAADDRAADLVDCANRRPKRARRLSRPTGAPLPDDDQAKTRQARHGSPGRPLRGPSGHIRRLEALVEDADTRGEKGRGMGEQTAIEWAESTWNPVTGCDRVSPGCDHCYALSLSARLKAMGQPKYQTDGRPETSGPGFGVTVHPDELDRPLSWAKPRRVFVCSMSDLFHPQVPDAFIASVFAVMAVADRHTFQVLTKRPQRVQSLLTSATFATRVAEIGREHYIGDQAGWRRAGRLLTRGEALPNVWLGVSVEDQQRADQRIPQLLDTPAAIRFLSAEPLLGLLDLFRLLDWGCDGSHRWCDPDRIIDWVIVGGESGPGARPMHPAWARQLVRQCQQAGVAVFMKQLGSHFGRDHHKLDHFPSDLQVREYPDEPWPVDTVDTGGRL